MSDFHAQTRPTSRSVPSLLIIESGQSDRTEQDTDWLDLFPAEGDDVAAPVRTVIEFDVCPPVCQSPARRGGYLVHRLGAPRPAVASATPGLGVARRRWLAAVMTGAAALRTISLRTAHAVSPTLTVGARIMRTTWGRAAHVSMVGARRTAVLGWKTGEAVAASLVPLAARLRLRSRSLGTAARLQATGSVRTAASALAVWSRRVAVRLFVWAVQALDSTRAAAAHAGAAWQYLDGRARGRVLISRGAVLVVVLAAGVLSGVGDIIGRRASQMPPIAADHTPVAELLLASNPVRPLAALRSRAEPITPRRSPSAANGPSRRDETRAIQSVLNRYRDALSVLDPAGVKQVWPSADVDVLRAGFAGRVEQNVEFNGCRISAAGSAATATCAGVVESGFRAGNRRPRIQRTRWEFNLRKTASRWVITDVGTQPG